MVDMFHRLVGLCLQSSPGKRRRQRRIRRQKHPRFENLEFKLILLFARRTQ